MNSCLEYTVAMAVPEASGGASMLCLDSPPADVAMVGCAMVVVVIVVVGLSDCCVVIGYYSLSTMADHCIAMVQSSLQHCSLSSVSK